MRRRAVVHVTAKEKDDGAKQENNGRKSKCKIITIILRTMVIRVTDPA